MKHYRIHNGKVKKSKIEIGFIPIKFNKKSQEEMTIVVIKSEDYLLPMYLLTNKKCETAHQATKIYQTYLQRWSVEMIIRFMKEGYNLEDFRVLTYQGIQNLISITAMVIHIVGKIVYEAGNIRIIKKNLIEIARRIKTEGKFLYYSISDGLKILFGKLTKKLIIFPSSYMGQYSLFGQYMKNG